MSDVLKRLAEVIESRRSADPATSYVARLLAKGEDAILKKIGEEATETVMAGKDGERTKIVYEVADLWLPPWLRWPLLVYVPLKFWLNLNAAKRSQAWKNLPRAKRSNVKGSRHERPSKCPHERGPELHFLQDHRGSNPLQEGP